MQKLSFTIDSKDSSEISRFIWQQIFNLYRKSIQLNDIDSMLYDLGCIEKRIKYAFRYNRICKMIWFIEDFGTSIVDYYFDETDEDENLVISFNPNTSEIEIEIPDNKD